MVGVMVILLAWVAAPGSAGAGSDLIVSPLEHEFGEVELGSSSSTVITITNVGFLTITLEDIDLQSGSSPDFSITSPPPQGGLLMPTYSAYVAVTFTLSAVLNEMIWYLMEELGCE